MTAAIDPGANALLKALLQAMPDHWSDELESIELPLGTVLHEPYRARDEVFFPVTAVVSLLCVLADGSTAEIAVIGHEGVVGISFLAGDNITPSRAIVQCAGSAIRMRAGILKREFVRQGEVALLLLRFTQALITQMSQTAVCNRHHSIDQHLCRWLLMMLDRHAGDEIQMTHELIASMLGVRRESVSTAAARLQRLGAITYWRGRITVLDRRLLEARACECYAVVKAEYDRLLPPNGAASERPQRDGGSRQDPSRLLHLRETGILDTPAEPHYDDIARQASELLDVPIAMVSFLDEHRDWFKSCVGFVASESPAETSFCSVFFDVTDDVVVVPDTRTDPRFASHPFVRGMPFIRFYAAVRLVSAGHTIGTLCVYDVKERKLESAQLRALEALAAAALTALPTKQPPATATASEP